MPGLPWFALATDFSGHPKTVRLCKLLGDRNAGMYIVRLLEHCAKYSPDGLIPEEMIEHAAGWVRPAGKFLSAAADAGFLERSRPASPGESAGAQANSGEFAGDEPRWRVHGWTDWNGAHLRKAAKDNARPNAKYRRPAKTPRGVSSGPRAGEESTGEDSTEKRSAAITDRLSPPAPPAAAPPPPPAGAQPAPPFPLTEQVRRQVSDGLGALQNGGRGLAPLRSADDLAAFEADVARVGVPLAVETCVARARRNGSGRIGSLSYFAGILHELAAASPAAGGDPREVVGMDANMQPIYRGHAS